MLIWLNQKEKNIELFSFVTGNNLDVTFLFSCDDKFVIYNSVKELRTLELNFTDYQ